MKQNLKINLGQSATKGVKEENEDFHGAYIPRDEELESKGIAIAIADGMSGCDGGKEASELSIKQFLSDYYSTPESWTAMHAVNQVMSSLNSLLVSQGQRQESTLKGLVTTFSALILKSQTAHLFHIGDSRIYRLRGNELEQLTKDHRIWLNKDKTALSRALGIDTDLKIDYRRVPLEINDIFILTTDGLHDFVRAEQIKKILLKYPQDPQLTADALVALATSQKSDDNISCQVVSINEISKASKQEFYEKLTKLPFPPDLKVGQQIDGLKILRELSATPRSQVYLVEDTLSPKRPKVVLKTPSVNFEDDPSYIDLFLHEEWVAKRLNSPHLVKVYQTNRQRQFLYSTIEYIEGQTLQQWMHDNPTPNLTQVRHFISQIILALRCMHRMEMIHQDIKPDNIILDEHDNLILFDFGSTKVIGLAEIQTVIEHNSVVGTANYSAPEYFKGQAGSNRSDIYSLGVIAYELLTGHLPYGEVSPERADKKKFYYQSACLYNQHIPEWIDSALAKAVTPNPSKRYSLLSEFLADLSRPNESLLTSKSFKPLIERNPLLFWKSLALLEAVLLGGIILMNLFFK